MDMWHIGTYSEANEKHIAAQLSSGQQYQFAWQALAGSSKVFGVFY